MLAAPRSTESQHPHGGALSQREGVPDGIVVEATGQQHPRLGIGQFGDQRGRQGRRVNQGQCRGQLVLRGLPPRSRSAFSGVGQRGQPLARRPAAVGVDGHRSGDDGTSGEDAIECLPGQVIAHVQPVEPVGGLERPGSDQQQGHEQHRQRDDDDPGDQLATCTFAPAPATVSYTRMIWPATTDQS